MCSECAAKMKKKKAKMRGLDASGFIAPLAMGGGAYLGKKGADLLTEKVDFLAENKTYAAGAKVLGGVLGFNPVAKMINSLIPVPLFGEGLMGGIVLSGIEDGMSALAAVKGDSDNYDWERLYNQQQVEAEENGRL